MSDDDYTQAEIVRSLGRIEKSQAEISGKLDRLPDVYATKEYVAEVKDGLGREVRDLKVALEAKSMPWDRVVGGLASLTAIAVALIALLGK